MLAAHPIFLRRLPQWALAMSWWLVIVLVVIYFVALAVILLFFAAVAPLNERYDEVNNRILKLRFDRQWDQDIAA